MSFSPSSRPMAFTFGTHQSTSPLVFCREIDTSTPFRKRNLSDPSPDGPTRKRRRLRLSLTTSFLSLPFSTPRASSQPDGTSTRNRRNAVFILRPSQHVLPRSSISAFPASSSSCSLLRKAAVLNRVQQRVDAACQRNPNLRWEKEQREERELLLRQGIDMRRMAALKDGLLSPVTSTRPVGSPPTPVQYFDLYQRPAATTREVDVCATRPEDEKAVEEEDREVNTASTLPWYCGKIKDGYPTPPPSAVGLSNYDALDSEEHEEEKDEGAPASPQEQQQQSNNAATAADEGMRDIFDFLTPPAAHQSFLDNFDNDDYDGGENYGRGTDPMQPNDANDSRADPEAASIAADGPVQLKDSTLFTHTSSYQALKQLCPLERCQPAPLTPSRDSPRVWRTPGPRCHHQHHHRNRIRHGHSHSHDRQHHCAMAAAFVAVPRAY